MTTTPVYIGIDVGTSGVRAIAVDDARRPVAVSTLPLPPPRRDGSAVSQDPAAWWDGVCAALKNLTSQLNGRLVAALAVDGTSGTVLLTDEHGTPLGPALMYNDSRATAQAARVGAVAPDASAAHGPSAGLAKALWLQEHYAGHSYRHVLHQADWIVGKLCGRWGVSDTNNALKTGYDAADGCWPRWLETLNIVTDRLPQVVTPGTLLGQVAAGAAHATGLAAGTTVRAGTTDSTAAIIATGVHEPAQAVTSLGSTLVTKVIAAQPVFSPRHGVYSQPFGNLWLVGGGSNTGGAVLRHFFSNHQMAQLTRRLRPDVETGLDYYPLLVPGERFPVCDPQLAPRLTPRPEDDSLFFQGMLEGMARIEQQAYRLLQNLGAPYPTLVRSAGGGAGNAPWQRIRERMLGVPVTAAEHQEAAYGTALLAAGFVARAQ